MKIPQRVLVLAILLSGLVSQAAVTPVRFYHLGEGDAGLGHNVVATSSIDSVSTNALSFTSAPKYWGHAARGNTNSTFSVLFSTADTASAAVAPQTDNVCLEAWANTGWRNYHVVAYNGSAGTNGYGFILDHNNYLAVLGGVGTVATIPCPPGEWIHLALVCSNGTVAVFANGTLAAVTNATPIAPTGNLNIGGPNTGDFFTAAVDDIKAMDIKGFVDDVRISTFASGAFNVTDLLYAPSPKTQLSVTRDGNNVVLSVPANKTLARLQSATSLTSPDWQNVDLPETLASHNTWTNSLQGTAKFYRLNPSSGIVPLVIQPGPNGPNVPVPFGVSPTSDIDFTFILYFADCNFTPNQYILLKCYTVAGEGFAASDHTSFDASFCVDPLTETTNTLSFYWEVVASTFYDSGKHFTGLADYYSPVLDLPENSLPGLDDDGSDPDMAYWRASLLMRHIPFTPSLPTQQTVRAFRFQYLASNYGFSASDPNFGYCTKP